MNFKIKYLIPHKEKQFFHGSYANTMHINRKFDKVMNHVGKAIKEGKEVIFDYQDNWITIEINK